MFLFIFAHILCYELGVEQAKQFEDHMSTILVAEVIAECVLLAVYYKTYFKYKKPRRLWKLIFWIEGLLLRYRLNRIYEGETDREYDKVLVANALKKVRSIEKDEKMMGITQLYQLGTERDSIEIIYNSLLHILESESDKKFKKIIVQAICDFHNKL